MNRRNLLGHQVLSNVDNVITKCFKQIYGFLKVIKLIKLLYFYSSCWRDVPDSYHPSEQKQFSSVLFSGISLVFRLKQFFPIQRHLCHHYFQTYHHRSTYLCGESFPLVNCPLRSHERLSGWSLDHFEIEFFQARDKTVL